MLASKDQKDEAVIFGGYWGRGTLSSSYTSNWNYSLFTEGRDFSVRGRSKHFKQYLFEREV